MSESYAEFQEADGSVRMAGQLAYPQATPSDVLTVQDDGTIAAAAGGGGSAFPTQSGPASPTGSVVPTGIGSLYVDTTAGGIFIAKGVTSADWIAVGGAGNNEVGITSGPIVNVVGDAEQDVYLTDKAAAAGTGNGFYWNFDGVADGMQNAAIQRGASLADTWNADGTYTSANGIILPTSDPHIAGALYNLAGVPTISSG